GKKWRELHTLPAETNALAIEIDMDDSLNSGAGEQRRRELNEEVVAVLEDMDRFQLAMRCLAYGEEAFPWDAGDRGLLLHKHTPRENNEGGNSYWRLTVAGHHPSVAPTHYQLSNPAVNPDLWEAILQLVVVGKGKEKSNEIDTPRVETTIAQAQTIHQSRLRQADKLTWQPNQKYRYDTQFKEEGLDKAAQVIRLNSLIDEIDKKLKSGTVEYGGEDGKEKTIEWQWVWQKRAEGAQVTAPEGMNPDVQKAVIRDVDLYTALRWAANDERKRLSRRLYDLGKWPSGKVPIDKILLYDLPKGWICPEGHHNALINEFCTECGKPQNQLEPAPTPSFEVHNSPEEAVDPQIVPTKMQEQLDALKKLLEANILTQAEYDDKVAALRGTAINPEMQEQLDTLKKLLEANILTQAEYDAKVAVLRGAVINPEMQEQLDALKKLLEANILTQAEYDAKVGELRGQ
ncbi:MAG: SHOCT domain-containing protein, partial [Anaerolineales bacterium]|nr:SHOCT domain-containing protein [Anaerolineales bacterium]